MALSNITGLPPLDETTPILIAGPTASGKSALALDIAENYGGVIVNADASQVFDCWRIVTARPSVEEETRAPHLLYGHVSWDQNYSAGHWVREVEPLLNGSDRPIIVGGTGLYFQSLIRGMADIPPTPPQIRAFAETMSLDAMLGELDDITRGNLDQSNRMRVQRAWEVQKATGRTLAGWHADTPPPVLAIEETIPLVFDVPKDWLLDRITRRFDLMLEMGALDEVAAMRPAYDAAKPAFKAIGVPELMRYCDGSIDLDTARAQATIATRQFAKRQRTWFRSKMHSWNKVTPPIGA